jgi:VanZ family protein
LIGLGALYGLTDEFHQIFVRGRSPDWADWGADVVGVLLGYFLVIGLSTSSDHGVDASR